jgi:hypothetical protein
MKFSKLFITGCDKNTEWMLPWFIDNFTKNNDCPLMIFDFGMSPEVAQRVDAVKVKGQDVGWFKKPKAMIQATKHATNICWLDTDCHVQANIEDIFDYVESNKIAMVEDAPWSKRRGEKWHNSGVVAFNDRPNILDEWATAVAANPQVGDQEVLHALVKDGMRRMIHITDLPRKYNTLRLDIDDGTAPSDTAVMHWTGHRGKAIIRKMMQ